MKHLTQLKTWLAMCLLFVGVGASWATTYKLEQVSSIDTKSKYVFIQDGHAMDSTTSNSSLQTVTDYKTTGLEGNESYVWRLEKEGSGFCLINCSLSTNPYLKNTSNTNLSFANSSGPTVWTFDFSDPSSVIIKDIDGNRFLGFANASDYVYKAYAISRLSSYPHAIKVYKLVEETLYTVSFDANVNGTCGTVSLTEETEGAGVTLPTCTANTGYAFIGWATTAESSTANAGTANETYIPSGDITLYAVYEIEDEATLTIKEGKYGTFVAPFEITLPAGVNAYTVVSIDENGATLSNAITGRLDANTPVLVSGTAGTYNFYGPASTEKTVGDSYLVGILQNNIEVPANSYVLQDQGTGQKFYKVVSAATGKKNRCYLAAPADVKVLNLIDGSEETSIESIFDEETSSKSVYDLSGRKVINAQKGIYIVNGKKMLVK